MSSCRQEAAFPPSYTQNSLQQLQGISEADLDSVLYYPGRQLLPYIGSCTAEHLAIPHGMCTLRQTLLFPAFKLQTPTNQTVEIVAHHLAILLQHETDDKAHPIKTPHNMFVARIAASFVYLAQRFHDKLWPPAQ